MVDQANTEAGTAYVPRLKADYAERIRAAMTEQFGYTNPMQVPKLEKIVLASARRSTTPRRSRRRSRTCRRSPARSR